VFGKGVKMVQIFEHYGPLSETTLAEYENKWGCILPSDYRKFLLRFNGGYPEPDAFRFRNNSTRSLVDRFLGIHDREHSNLLKYLNTYTIRLPKNLFPVAHDPGGNLICLSVKGETTGKVYFWDHENEADEGEEPDYRNVYLIADTFDEFLAGLQDESILTTY
jgi:hypothetical protein